MDEQFNWSRVQELFDQASSLPQNEVEGFLAAECGEDAGLLRTIRELLAEAEAQPAEFLQGLIAKDAVGLSAAMDRQGPANDRTGQRIGPYLVERKTGSGGMGEVYQARRVDEHYDQRVAIKVVRQTGSTDSLLGRFRQERQILARLEHPNIVRLLDGGTTPDGMPFLAMDFVEGVPITEYCDTHNPDVKERCRLMLPICDAVEHAHRHLVLHRDIKPANILVTPDGTPKLLDFGIAKLLDSPDSGEQTVLDGYRPLTPDYASPEQLGNSGPLTTSTDIYQLGAVLYRLLTGRKPADAIAHPAPGEPGMIARQAMHPDLSQRYGTVQQLAKDLRSFLEGRPIVARQDSFFYRANKWIRRSPLTATALALAAVSMVAGVSATLYQARRAERRFQQVRSLAGTFVFQFDDQIKDLVGSTAARSFVVETAIRYLDSLTEEAGGDLSILAETGAAYVNIGLIQGSPLMANLGKTSEAIVSFDKAVALARQVLAREPNHRAALRTLIQALTQKGTIAYYTLRDHKQGQGFTTEAQALAGRLEAFGNLTAPDLKTIATANRLHGDGIVTTQPKVAAVFFEKSLTLLERGHRETGKDEWVVPLAGTLISLARAQREAGNTVEWVRRLEAARAIIEPMQKANPEKESSRRQLWTVLLELGKGYSSWQTFHMRQEKKALEVLGRAAEMADAPKLAPFEAALERALAKNDAAGSVFSQQSIPVGFAAVRDGIAAVEDLKRLDPKYKMADNILRQLDLNAARLQMRGGQVQAAVPALIRLRGQRVRDLEANPADLAAKESLGYIENTLTECYLEQKDLENAGKVLTDAMAHAAQAVAQHKNDLYFLRNQAWILETAGDYHHLRKDVVQQKDAHRKALAVWETFVKLSSSMTYPGPYLEVLRAKLADDPVRFTHNRAAILR